MEIKDLQLAFAAGNKKQAGQSAERLGIMTNEEMFLVRLSIENILTELVRMEAMLQGNEMKNDENNKISVTDGWTAHGENSQLLAEVCEKLLLKETNGMTPKEILKKLLDQKLYHFPDSSQTPLCTVSSRLASPAEDAAAQQENETQKDETCENLVTDKRTAHGKNRQTLAEVCEELLLKEGKEMTPREILKKLLDQKLYHFSDSAKTPLNTVSSRLSAIAGYGNMRIYKVSRGHYAAK